MNKIKVTKIEELYFEDCEICGKRIKGQSEAQVKYRMKIHQLSKYCRK